MSHPSKEQSVPLFLDACTTNTPDTAAGGGALHTAYTTWCQRAQIALPLTTSRFYEALRFHRRHILDPGGRAVYADCQILPEDQWDLEAAPRELRHNGSLGRFLTDHVEARTGARTAKAKLHSRYEGWCRDHHLAALPRKAVAQRLHAVGIQSETVGGTPCYIGIAFIASGAEAGQRAGR